MNKLTGLLLCAKYAVAPNLFGYCGPDDNKNIIDHLQQKIADQELAHLISDFETLYPYLQLIARENNIENPFTESVVEAYWLGNQLLENIKGGDYLAFLEERLQINKKIGVKKMIDLKTKISSHRFLPNHGFHVMNIFKRTGNDLSEQTVKTMDQCRIGWGEIIKIPDSTTIFVKTRALIVNKLSQHRAGQLLMLSEPIIKKITTHYHGKQFIKDYRINDWVSFHWGMICDKLTKPQVINLEYYTKKAIDFYNG